MNFSSVLRRKAFCVFHNHPLSYSLGSLLVPALKVPCSRGTPQSWGGRRDRLLPHRDIHDTIIIQGHLRMTSSLPFLAGLRRCVFTFFPASLSRLLDLCSGEQTGPVGKGVTIGKVPLLFARWQPAASACKGWTMPGEEEKGAGDHTSSLRLHSHLSSPTQPVVSSLLVTPQNVEVKLWRGRAKCLIKIQTPFAKTKAYSRKTGKEGYLRNIVMTF